MRNRKNLLPLFLVLALGALLGYMYYQWWKNRLNNWEETLDPKQEIPFGTKVLKQLLDREHTGSLVMSKKRIAKALHNLPDSTGNWYVFLGSGYYPSQADADSLLGFVSRGNTAFIASYEVYDALEDTLSLVSSTKIFYKTLDTPRVHLAFRESFQSETIPLPFTMSKGFDTTSYAWGHFGHLNNHLSQRHLEVLGTYDLGDSSYVNLIRIPWGGGQFYLHAEPILFTNYFLLHPTGYAYANYIFPALPPPNNIYWDQASLRPSFERDPTNYGGPAESPLRFILSQPSLAWGYYSLLFLVALFIIFRGKRLQRVIPIIKQNTNTSLAFNRTIGQLYYQQKNHLELALLKRELFLAFLKSRYYLPLHTVEGLETYRNQLLLKSQYPVESYDTLVEELQKLDTLETCSAWFLSDIHQKLEDFYTNCK